jgi:peptidoglycan hydrolase CwlO-like protein
MYLKYIFLILLFIFSSCGKSETELAKERIRREAAELKIKIDSLKGETEAGQKSLDSLRRNAERESKSIDSLKNEIEKLR